MLEAEEIDFLKNYDINKYDRPSLTTDIVIFTVKNEETDDYRRLSKKKLSVLLTKRQEPPFKNTWSLPGGFVKSNESVEENAYRKLEEKAGISEILISQLGVFSEIGRDPRGWVVSCAFMALAQENKFNIKHKNIEAKWFTVQYKKNDDIYDLILKNDEDVIHSKLGIDGGFLRSNKYKNSVNKSKGIAFDHSNIIACAIDKLRYELYSHKLSFEFLPKYFTLTDLQSIDEIILDKKLIKPNYRRKIKDLVIETDEFSKGAGHRPAKLYCKRD